jgi:hypothetical protein
MLKLVSPQSEPNDVESTEVKVAEVKPVDKLQAEDKISKGETIVKQSAPAKLKLVVSNPSPLPVHQEKLSRNIRNSEAASAFTAEVQLRGPWLYEMQIRDPSYYLKCNLSLEVEEAQNEFEPGKVICHFPVIKEGQLRAFVEEDEVLYSTLMVQFQMKVMEQLLLFCGDYSVSQLVIYTDDAQAGELGIYDDFLVYQDQTITSQGEKTKMVIPTDTETFDDWIDFMEEANLRLVQGLWNEQKYNPVIRAYLKSCSSSS